ncbi:HNH endonuclease [Undibacterium sp. SXout7W]|uniref:HNH endonuclease n=1 Tax=Undibacterium sp. SXout7W TaxID=3413049 RepID=UPI003BF058B3
MELLDMQLTLLKLAIEKNRSNTYCLSLWSNFIRTRDGNRCVLCHEKNGLAAHHIIRKSFWKYLRYQTGNGITLCRACHKEPHANFNRRPNLALPMDSEGGEKIDLFTGFLGALVIDANIRGVQKESYYHFDDEALITFKQFQGIPDKATFDGPRIEQAYRIWNQTPRGMLEAILKSVGVKVENTYVQDETITMYSSDTLKKIDGSSADILYIRYIPPAPFKIDPTKD